METQTDTGLIDVSFANQPEQLLTLGRQKVDSPAHFWRTVRTALWLGWKIESNWTDPYLFLIYSMLRPLAGALIFVFMYFAVARGGKGEMLGFFIVGSAMWPFVLGGMQGMAWGIIQDREHFRTLRYLYTSPISYRTYLAGRALALSVALGLPASMLTLALGLGLLDIPFTVGLSDVPYLLAAFALGLAGLLSLGLIVVAAVMSVSGDAWRLPEALGAGLFLVSGAIFPIFVLPGFLEKVAAVIPLTWWLEAMRRGLLGAGGVKSFPWASDSAVIGYQLLVTLGASIVGMTAATWADKRARRLGILDRETGF